MAIGNSSIPETRRSPTLSSLDNNFICGNDSKIDLILLRGKFLFSNIKVHFYTFYVTILNMRI